MSAEIVLFHYYSYSSPVPTNVCALRLVPKVAYRNMFLTKTDDKVHFEFPMFEDHSYNTICNGKGLRKLIQSPATNKYIIFRTGRDITQRFLGGTFRPVRRGIIPLPVRTPLASGG